MADEAVRKFAGSVGLAGAAWVSRVLAPPPPSLTEVIGNWIGKKIARVILWHRERRGMNATLVRELDRTYPEGWMND